MAYPVAGRVIIADPDFPSIVSGDRASYLFGIAPDDLRVMAAHVATSIRAVVVVPPFVSPRANHFRGGGTRSRDCEQVLAPFPIGTVGKFPAREQGVGPIPRDCFQTIRPGQRRNADLRSDLVVGEYDIARESAFLCADAPGGEDQNEQRQPHATTVSGR